MIKWRRLRHSDKTVLNHQRDCNILLDAIYADAPLKISDTVMGSQVMGIYARSGYFSFVYDFTTVNSAETTYTVTVSFDGEGNASTTATSTSLDGSGYVMCTTVQFSNQPSSNSTMLTVDPQSLSARVCSIWRMTGTGG